MSRRNQNECAHCAETIAFSTRTIGKDWKVYCSTSCAQAGEKFSQAEQMLWQNYIVDRHTNEYEPSGLLYQSIEPALARK